MLWDHRQNGRQSDGRYLHAQISQLFGPLCHVALVWLPVQLTAPRMGSSWSSSGDSERYVHTVCSHLSSFSMWHVMRVQYGFVPLLQFSCLYSHEIRPSPFSTALPYCILLLMRIANKHRGGLELWKCAETLLKCAPGNRAGGVFLHSWCECHKSGCVKWETQSVITKFVSFHFHLILLWQNQLATHN